jgi:hypothetical protein
MTIPADKFAAFAAAVRRRESGGDYQIVNSLGYLGAYQFGMARLCDLGFTERIPGTKGYGNSKFRWKSGWSSARFLNDPGIQDDTFRRHVRSWVRYVEKKAWTRFIGTPAVELLGDGAPDCEVTLSGMIGVVHLLGPGGLRSLLEGQDQVDGYGTRGSEYLAKFGGFF